MRSKFSFKNQEYEVAIEKKERGEDDKFNPYAGKVTGGPAGAIEGTFQVTDAALEAADKRAAAGGGDAGSLLAEACGKSVAAELVIRKLKPDFSFVVDYRWL